MIQDRHIQIALFNLLGLCSFCSHFGRLSIVFTLFVLNVGFVIKTVIPKH